MCWWEKDGPDPRSFSGVRTQRELVVRDRKKKTGGRSAVEEETSGGAGGC